MSLTKPSPLSRLLGASRLPSINARVEDQPRIVIGNLCLPPQFNLALEWLEVPLVPVHSHRERIRQVEALGVFGQRRRENTSASHVVAGEDNGTASCPSCP